MIRPPPRSVASVGASSNANQTHNGPSAVSSSISRPTSAAGKRRGPSVISVNAMGRMKTPTAMSAGQSPAAGCSVSAMHPQMIAERMEERPSAGVISQSRRTRPIVKKPAIDIAAIRALILPADVPSENPASKIIAIPAAIATAAAQVRSGGRSPRKAANIAAKTGAVASMVSVSATVLWVSA